MGPFVQRERDLFSVRVPPNKDKANKKRKLKKKGEEHGEGVRKKARFDGIAPDDMQPLTYQNITAGQTILGCIQEIREYELVVSLPHLLLGTVTVARISKAYTNLLTKVAESEDELEEKVHTLKELYRPGQYVVTRVVSLEEVNNKIKVNLTLMPQEVNFGISSSLLEVGHVIPCAVCSVEDNGYVMDTGIPNIRAAFLKNTNIDGAGIVGVGSVVRCIITKLKGNKEEEDTVQLQLSANVQAVSAATLDLCDTTNMALLLPGTAINTSVSKIHKQGLKVLLADVDGVVDGLHLQTPFSHTTQYKLAYKVRARVLYVTPLTKIVHLTLQPNVCAKSTEPDPLHGLKIGERVEAEIYESKRSGIYVKLGENCRGFCSSNHLTDKGTPPRKIQSNFPIGAKKMCCLIKYNYMDQLFIVSFKKSILEQQTIGYQGLEAGQVIEATIKKYSEHGAEVAISKFVSGQIPYNHLTDSHMQDPKKKYSIGNTVKARVLKVNPERRHLLLTCKKQLVQYEGEVITKFSEDCVEKITRGCVVCILPSGLLVNFYNDVKGFVPKSMTQAGKGEKLDDVYDVGQVVECKVLKVYPEKKSMTLSLYISKNKLDKQAKKKKKKQKKNEGGEQSREEEQSKGEVEQSKKKGKKRKNEVKEGQSNKEMKEKNKEGKKRKREVEDESNEQGNKEMKKKSNEEGKKKSKKETKKQPKEMSDKDVEGESSQAGDESEDPAEISKTTINNKKNKHLKKEQKPGDEELDEPAENTEEISNTASTNKKKKKHLNKEQKPDEELDEPANTEEISKTAKTDKKKTKLAEKEEENTEEVSKNTNSDKKKKKNVNKEQKPGDEELDKPADNTKEISKTANTGKKKTKLAKEEEENTEEVLKTGRAGEAKDVRREKQRAVDGDSEEAVESSEIVAKKKKKSKKSKKGSEEITEGQEKEKAADQGDSGVEEMYVGEDTITTANETKKWLSTGTKFIWDVPDTLVDTKASSSDDDSDDDDAAAKRKKTKRLSKAERIAAEKEEERRLHQLECARLEDNRNPQTALDFEELLQRTPNSSTTWIQFISFHLENAEVEQAKGVARRALQVIDPQEEEERLNLWTVLLRLEVTYGTPEEVAKAYTEAQTACDQLKIQMAMAMVYAEANKLQEAEKVYYVMSKKYSQSLDVWVKAGIYFFSHRKAEEGRKYLERALLSLNKKYHVDLINRFGQLEFRFGEAERGRTMFESLLSNYPKRIDIWSVYVDLLAKHGDTEGARHILDRMTGLKLRLRKMRFVFKKFLAFEKEHGSSQRVEAVKKRVEEFVASTLHQES